MTQRITIRVDDDLLHSFDNAVHNRSEAIRDFMRDTADVDADAITDETLAQAYDVLLEQGRRYEGSVRCVAADVSPIIANRCNVEGGTQAVRGRIFRRLERLGFIRPRAGYIWVKPQGKDPVEYANGADNGDSGK